MSASKSHSGRMRKLIAVSSLMVLGLALPGLAIPHARADDDDHDLARRLVEKGEIRALSEIMEQVSAQYPGKVLEVEFESEHGRYTYEFKILRTDGKVVEVDVDARSGAATSELEDD
jgi:uncharacterized membrane protein YkoI